MRTETAVLSEASRGTAHSRAVREKLLDVAERLFAEQGLAATTVRAITAEAGANVAAVNYHFGSREALLREVIARRLGPLNAERLRCLEAVPEPTGTPADVERVLRALVVPGLDLCFRHPHFARLASQLRWDPDRLAWEEYRQLQAGLRDRFLAAFVRALPHVPRSEVAERLHYVLGGIHQVWAHCPPASDTSPARLVASFIAFYSAGLQAPAPAEEKTPPPGE